MKNVRGETSEAVLTEICETDQTLKTSNMTMVIIPFNSHLMAKNVTGRHSCRPFWGPLYKIVWVDFNEKTSFLFIYYSGNQLYKKKN